MTPEMNAAQRILFVQTFFDPALWSRAGWTAVAFEEVDWEPPRLLLVFRDDSAGKKVFDHWIYRLGRVDKYDELRIAIIEGEIEGRASGYSVLLGSEPQRTAKRAKDMGESLDVSNAFTVGRFLRVNPSPGSKGLSTFRRLVERARCYDVLPATLSSNGITAHELLSIRKRVIHFRDVQSIAPNEPESAVLAPEDSAEGEGTGDKSPAAPNP